MIKRMLLMLIALALVFGGIFGWKYYTAMLMQQRMASMKPPPSTVTTYEAEATTWQPELHAVGSLQAVRGVSVSPEVAGRVIDIRFQSGRRVRKGELLVALNTSTEEAELDRLQAQKDLAETQLRRVRELRSKNQTSQAEVDQAAAEVETLSAQIARERTIIDKMNIRAPFSGVVGIRKVDLGQYVSPGTDLVNLQALQPLYVDFTLPQQNLRHIREGMPVELTVDTYPDRTFRGEITALDPRVAQSTRNFAVRATLENKEKRLRPGMFADVAVQLPEQREVVTLPKTAITSQPYGDSVFVVQEKKGPDGKPVKTVTKRFVRTGDRRGSQVAVSEGVSAGETVVTSGQLKLREGARIKVNNEVRPDSNPSPTPPNK
ncbi:efflux RND transporter periplasmic adaptor subunit [Thiohalorhabdus methylotrophus]|uniref:Efflux RND transporter periplasmic adaptor subunit n=1 Tax=Thiohalorhabdus methylotrophus TaxID=3242694 RepID=A0ABV4TXP9_9GAMM